jgi:exoribonuclease R
MAGRASVELYKLIFFDGKVTKADAIVCRMTSKGVDVFIPEFGIEGSVYFSSIVPEREQIVKEQESSVFDETTPEPSNEEPKDLEFDEDNFKFSISGKTLKIFDAVQVSISVGESAGSRKYLKMEITQWPDEFVLSSSSIPNKRKRIPSTPNPSKKRK